MKPSIVYLCAPIISASCGCGSDKLTCDKATPSPTSESIIDAMLK